MRRFSSEYASSVAKALALGYTRVPDERAFMGEYYVKNGKIWIFKLEALGKRLGARCHRDFSAHRYAIEDYLLYAHLDMRDLLLTVYGEDSDEFACFLQAEAAEAWDFDEYDDDGGLSFSDLADLSGGYLGDGLSYRGGRFYGD